MTREQWDKLTADEQWAKYLEVCALQVETVMKWGHHIGIRRGVPGSVDDNGKPPPPGLVGDMFPTWYDGRWWTCFSDYEQRKRKNGDLS